MSDVNLQRRVKRHIQAPEHDFFAVTAPGLEDLCAAELANLGAAQTTSLAGGVAFHGRLEAMLQANLWLRTAGRVLMRLADFRVRTWADLTRQAAAVPWELLLPADGSSLDVRVSLHESNLHHAGRVAEEIFWAAAKAMERQGLTAPVKALPGQDDALILQVRGVDRRASISLDTSGAHLHKRGYRQATAKAPLRETLAAALLMLCGYDGSRPLLDPMCGAGTLAIEAALMARALPPGLGRDFAFQRLAFHRPAAWAHLQKTAAANALAVPPAPIFAGDRLKSGLELAQANAARAGVAQSIQWGQADFFERPAPTATAGLVVINPPYGKRLGSVSQAEQIVRRIGRHLAEHYRGWRCGVVLYLPQWAELLGLEQIASLEVPHGGLKVTMFCGQVAG
ncbi:rRNA (guanine-N(2)-)-methyltransferase [Desulfarculus baarsii DSM 2075]|uniref:rRNA (Guanine-N(2)-)-methyltransferase n=1 Tax=Desulfarculus baarsii (strain ATCC 33931 / DSM 2075 / LMG 7858 / VKM B-1802 / 2st14) TaxID=644282 RepID=E1QL72_DESB2|nr:RNA methyltransferase [Desulfarculus baarsii]ADK85337.1 rRNA (guanine-N(2)-)-methyltransferase [Desulfarculus baarsii DSM 2075]